MAETVEKLTTGEPLTVDQLIEYLPALSRASAHPSGPELSRAHGDPLVGQFTETIRPDWR